MPGFSYKSGLLRPQLISKRLDNLLMVNSLAQLLSRFINHAWVLKQKILLVFLRERPENPFAPVDLVHFSRNTLLLLVDSCYLVLSWELRLVSPTFFCLRVFGMLLLELFRT